MGIVEKDRESVSMTGTAYLVSIAKAKFQHLLQNIVPQVNNIYDYLLFGINMSFIP